MSEYVWKGPAGWNVHAGEVSPGKVLSVPGHLTPQQAERLLRLKLIKPAATPPASKPPKAAKRKEG